MNQIYPSILCMSRRYSYKSNQASSIFNDIFCHFQKYFHWWVTPNCGIIEISPCYMPVMVPNVFPWNPGPGKTYKRPKDYQNMSRGCWMRSILVNPWSWRPSWTSSWILKNAQGWAQFTRHILFMWCLKPQNQQSEKLYQPSEGSALKSAMATWQSVDISNIFIGTKMWFEIIYRKKTYKTMQQY